MTESLSLDENTARTLESLAMVNHKSVGQYVADLVQLEALRTWPQRYEVTEKPRPPLPWKDVPRDPEADARLREGLAAAHSRAQARADAAAALEDRDWTGAVLDTETRATAVYSACMPVEFSPQLEAEAVRRGLNPSELIVALVRAGLEPKQ